MTTIIEALQDATHELHLAAELYQTRADAVATQLASFQSSAQTTINNYVNRSPIVGVFVDENNGIDADGRGLDGVPFKTLDYALDNTDQSVVRIFYLYSDCTIKKWHQIFNKVRIVGFAKIPSGSYGYPYTFTNRKLSFLPEATNSPRTDIGRCVPLFDCSGGSVDFLYLDFVIPMISAAVNYPRLVSPNGGDFAFQNCNITVENNSTPCRIFALNPVRLSIGFSATTLGAGVPGKIVDTVAAGAAPPAYYVTTNLASL